MMPYDQAVKELYYYLYGTGTPNFHSKLYELFEKADPNHMKLLRLAFPMEVAVWDDWLMSRGNVEFFERYAELKVRR